jgi:hypothetical protein
VWKPERKKIVDMQDASTERDRQKRQLLDEIAGLRVQMINLRVEMEKDRGPTKRFSDLALQLPFMRVDVGGVAAIERDQVRRI